MGEKAGDVTKLAGFAAGGGWNSSGLARCSAGTQKPDGSNLTLATQICRQNDETRHPFAHRHCGPVAQFCLLCEVFV